MVEQLTRDQILKPTSTVAGRSRQLLFRKEVRPAVTLEWYVRTGAIQYLDAICSAAVQTKPIVTERKSAQHKLNVGIGLKASTWD